MEHKAKFKNTKEYKKIRRAIFLFIMSTVHSAPELTPLPTKKLLFPPFFRSGNVMKQHLVHTIFMIFWDGDNFCKAFAGAQVHAISQVAKPRVI